MYNITYVKMSGKRLRKFFEGRVKMSFFSIWELLIRVGIAVLCGGIIGIDRAKKHRPAGFRTYILVCVGAAMTMILGQYLHYMLYNVWASELNYNFAGVDVSRFGAQVINGIGFLGAGTIIVTGKQQVKGMTTAAGLWASACMGLCIGAGFYEAAIACCLLILFTVIIFSRLERVILSRSRNINIFVEFEEINDISAIVESIKSCDVRIFDVEITKAKNSDTHYPNAVFSLRLPKKITHAALMAVIAQLDTIRSIEEL